MHPDDQPLDGGSTADPPDRATIEVKGPFDVEKHRGVVTVWLIALLAVVIVGHYCCLLVMEWNGKKADELTSAFNVALPVISGLTGSAVAYYFTKEQTRK
ncbi:MAG: hypothetical protein JO061_16630 [Acidobacteriaceae bacterium]|nr:hypothetical protein [Acidobacteriaceae bacterium]